MAKLSCCLSFYLTQNKVCVRLAPLFGHAKLAAQSAGPGAAPCGQAGMVWLFFKIGHFIVRPGEAAGGLNSRCRHHPCALVCQSMLLRLSINASSSVNGGSIVGQSMLLCRRPSPCVARFQPLEPTAAGAGTDRCRGWKRATQGLEHRQPRIRCAARGHPSVVGGVQVELKVT